MNKTELRKLYKERRRALDSDTVEELSLNIANRLLEMEIWHYSYYHIFLSIQHQKEVQTEYILNILSGKDKHIVVSKSDLIDYSLSHYLLTDATKLSLNRLGIPEPEGGIPIDAKLLDVVFVPLLAYDAEGNRIGYGKGFYDRFLKTCRPDCLKIGLSFFKAETGRLPNSETDVPLDFCVSPKRLYQFGISKD
jgi:5-formyltetrahydrofolate cyclo-ligase